MQVSVPDKNVGYILSRGLLDKKSGALFRDNKKLAIILSTIENGQKKGETLLTNRLRMEAWFEKHPEILDESIERPIVVVGLPRTGTTMLHRTVATDTSLLAPIWYEVRQPGSSISDAFKSSRK